MITIDLHCLFKILLNFQFQFCFCFICLLGLGFLFFMFLTCCWYTIVRSYNWYNIRFRSSLDSIPVETAIASNEMFSVLWRDMVNVNDWVLISRRFFQSSKYPFFENIFDHAMLYSVKQWPSMVLLWWSFSRPNWRTQYNHFALNRCGLATHFVGFANPVCRCVFNFSNVECPYLSWQFLGTSLFYSASHQSLMLRGIEIALCRHCLLVSRCLN